MGEGKRLESLKKKPHLHRLQSGEFSVPHLAQRIFPLLDTYPFIT
jgi:hypothetical protein